MFMRRYFLSSVMIASILFFVTTTLLHSAAPDSLRQAAIQATVEYRNAMGKLADWADEQGLKSEAAQTRSALLPSEPDKIYLPSFPLTIGTLDLPRGLTSTLPREYAVLFLEGTAPESVSDIALELTSHEVWLVQFRTFRMNYAKRLQLLAKSAVKDQRGSLAVQLAVAGLHADPDHVGFRTVFGFIKYKNEWRTPWEADRLKKDFVDHERFGWIPKKAVERYEKGERYFNGEWISEEEDVYKHSAIENGWKIESEHYDLTTNHSIEEGVQMIRQNEHFYRAWKLLFFRYMATDAQLATLFNGKAVPMPQDRHKIVLYKDREDFHQAERRRGMPNPERFGGMYRYDNNVGCGHFYAGGRLSTMYHESTHQLFHETKKIAGNQMLNTVSGNQRQLNYWIEQGVADFMGTFHIDDSGYYVVGNRNSGRIRMAKQNFQEGLFFPSFSELADINGREWSAHDEMSALYCQSMAMFHFLMFHENGRLRDPLVVLLRLRYEQKDTRTSIIQLTGMSYEELDTEFKKFLNE